MQDADGWNIISQMPNAFSSGGCHNEIEQPLSSVCDTDAAHVVGNLASLLKSSCKKEFHMGIILRKKFLLDFYVMPNQIAYYYVRFLMYYLQ